MTRRADDLDKLYPRPPRMREPVGHEPFSRGVLEGRSERPPRRHSEDVYSNFDHTLNQDAVETLAADPTLYAMHAAMGFVGYVWYRDGRWFEEVWQSNLPRELLEGESPQAVISGANSIWGHE
jgi:hypothetical protein